MHASVTVNVELGAAAPEFACVTHATPKMFGVGVGGRVTYQFTRLNLKTGRYAVAGYSTFKVTAIGDPPLVLVDQFDITNSGLLPPGATARFRRSTAVIGPGGATAPGTRLESSLRWASPTRA